MTWSVRVVLAAGLAFAATPALASTSIDIADRPVADDAALLKVAQGMTPEGWRVEGPPRYKRATTTRSKINEPTYFREEGPPRYKKSKKSSSATTGSGR